MQAITKVFSDIVKPYIDTVKQTLTQQINVSDAKNLCPTMNPSDPSTLESWSNYFTINADGSITANGTPPGRTSIASRVVLPAGQYIMNGCPSGGNWNAYRIMFLKYTPSETAVYADTGSTPTTVTLDEETEIVIRVDLYGNYTASNLVYKPMICLKSVYDLDPSYAPPAKTNQLLAKETTGLFENQVVNGAVNELENNNVTNVQTETTFTVNPDKTVTVTVASTTSAPRSMEFPFNFKKGTYKLTGNPIKDDAHITMTFYNVTDAQNIVADLGHGAVFTIDGTKRCSAYIDLRTGVPAGTYVFKPMISVASLDLSYEDYVPYAKSNKELTEESVMFSTKTVTVKGLGLTFQKCGNIVAVTFSGTSNEAITANTAFYSLTAAMQTNLHIDQKLVSGERMQIDKANQQIVFSGDIPSGTALRGTIVYASDNFTTLS